MVKEPSVNDSFQELGGYGEERDGAIETKSFLPDLKTGVTLEISIQPGNVQKIGTN